MELDTPRGGRYRRSMAQSILIFNFGTNEEAAQQARHKVEGWKQGFRLGNKLQLKFQRQEPVAEAEPAPVKPASTKGKAGKKESGAAGSKGAAEPAKEAPGGRVRVLVRLAFSDHEKISHQRWLGRIPGEEPFKSAQSETVSSGSYGFEPLAELFDSLD